jgi:hypothetical protein
VLLVVVMEAALEMLVVKMLVIVLLPTVVLVEVVLHTTMEVRVAVLAVQVS